MTRTPDPLRRAMMRSWSHAPGQRNRMRRRFVHEPLSLVLAGSAFARATEFRRFCRVVREGFALVEAVKANRTGAAP